MPAVKVSEKERFTQAVANAHEWGTIDDLIEVCDDAGYWSEEFLSHTEAAAKKSHVRRMIRSLKSADDWPIWASVESQNEEGKTVKMYKQETLFDVEDYRQIVRYHAERSDYHHHMAKGYAKRCRKRFGVQLQLPFRER